MQAVITSYSPGDVVFYHAKPNDLYDTVITDVTGSPIVHCAVAISALQKIEALNNGVMLTPFDSRPPAAVWSYTQHAQPLVPENLHRALAWLIGQKGNLYGWGDAMNAVLGKFEQAFTIDVGQHYDCSGLACEFLIKAGGVAELQNVSEAHNVTPAELAGYLGVV